jgi:hypothetical protein
MLLAIAALSCPVSPSHAGNFPDAHEAAPAWWPQKPRFVLSQDYPQTLPPPENYPWKAIDFRTRGFDYLRAVLAYVYEGNLPVPGQAGWEVQRNSVRKWYHAPWMHHDRNGREFIRGLTRERTSPEGELWADPPSPVVQNWAVGFYNDRGGYIVGQMWKDPNAPDPRKVTNFPDGTVGAKLLFTRATATDVPYLKGAFSWQANIHRNIECRRPIPDDSPLCEREVQTVRLLQIDIAVRDDRPENPSPTNWVFGTFVYDGNAPGATPWERMVPVGIMWGNDPNVTPDMVRGGYQLRESVINRAKLPPQHLGCAGRLNGPVDNPVSSCLSCHGLAQYPAKPVVPSACDGSTASLAFFENLNTASPRDPNVMWMDYSLQLSQGFVNFCEVNRSYPLCGLAPPAGPAALSAQSLPPDGELHRPTRGD